MAEDVGLVEVRTFVHLYELRSVTATAHELGVTQPTVSYTLAKLRRRFNDELFLRTPQGLDPSTRAKAMYPPLREALSGIDAAVGAAASFDPGTTEREFVAMMSDFGELSFAPVLVPEVARLAPEARLRVTGLVVDDVASQLVRGRIDVAITGAALHDERILARPFMTMDYAAIVAEDHPRIVGPVIDPDGFGKERFVAVRGAGSHFGPLRLLERLDLSDRIELELNSYASSPYVVAESALVAILPRHIATLFATRHAVRVVELPWLIEPIDVTTYVRRGASPAQQWFADLVVDVLTRVRLE